MTKVVQLENRRIRAVAKHIADKLQPFDIRAVHDHTMAMFKGSAEVLSAEDLADKQAKQFIWRGYIEICRQKGVAAAIEYLQSIIDDAMQGSHQS